VLTTRIRETPNKSILDFSASAIGKALFSDGSQDHQLTAADLGSASLRCGKRSVSLVIWKPSYRNPERRAATPDTGLRGGRGQAGALIVEANSDLGIWDEYPAEHRIAWAQQGP